MTVISNITTHTRIFESGIRFGKIIWLAACANGFGDDAAFEDLRNAFDDEMFTHPSTSRFANAPDDIWDIEDGFIEWVHDNHLLGFFVEVQIPIPYGVTQDSSYMTSWDSYYTIWMYVDEMLDAVPLAETWAELQLANAIAIARKNIELTQTVSPTTA